MNYELDEEFFDEIPTETELEESLQNFVSKTEEDIDYQRVIIYILVNYPGISSEEVTEKIKEMVMSAMIRNLHSQDLVEVYMDGTVSLSKNGKVVAKELLGE